MLPTKKNRQKLFKIADKILKMGDDDDENDEGNKK